MPGSPIDAHHERPDIAFGHFSVNESEAHIYIQIENLSVFGAE
jgi:hypothetical protein